MFPRCETLKHLVLRVLFLIQLNLKDIMSVLTLRQKIILAQTAYSLH